MKARSLLRAAREKWQTQHVADVPGGSYRTTFENGAVWMGAWMQHLRPGQAIELQPLRRFTRYGLLKYTLSLLAFGLAAVGLACVHVLLLPLAVCFFYAVEVHFLFLFPILLSRESLQVQLLPGAPARRPNKKRPLLESIRMTYTIGLFHATTTVLQIGFFMVIGLFNARNPLKNWHIGCLAVLIWFYEIRDRLSPQS